MYLIIKYSNSNSANDSREVEICHDDEGNIFIICSDIYYWLTIDAKDNLILEEINYESLLTIEDKIAYLKINQIKDSLKEKILEEIDDHDENNKEDENEEDNKDYEEDYDDEEYNLFKNNLKYHPEDKLYYIHNDGTNEGDQDDDIKKNTFIFYRTSDENFLRCLDRTFDSPSLYDTFVIDTSIANNAIVFTAESIEKSPYRITINTNNVFTLNIVGSKFKTFKLNYNDIGLYFA